MCFYMVFLISLILFDKSSNPCDLEGFFFFSWSLHKIGLRNTALEKSHLPDMYLIGTLVVVFLELQKSSVM